MERLVKAILFLAAVTLGQDIELTAPSGTFNSPNYPNNYAANTRMSWLIHGQSGKAIKLSFNSAFNVNRAQCTDCGCDSVTVYDGEDQTASILARGCGTKAPADIVATGNKMLVVFTSDNRRQAKGFAASYMLACPGAACGDGTCIPASAICDGEYHCVDESDEAPAKCDCGTPANTPAMPSMFRIVGGQEAQEHSYPWMVAVMSSSSGTSGQYCGGSIIDSEWILTAAHCMEGESPSGVYIKAGAHSKYSTNEGAVVVRASQIHIHHAYDNVELDSDIALVKLSTPLEFNGNINKVCLPSAGLEVGSGTPLVVSGWGTTTESGSSSTKLMEVTVPVISNSQCSSMYGSSYPITDTMMCAGYSEGGKDSCQGDSGGPVVHSSNGQNTGKFTQVGVVSWGIGCARAGKPGVYAKVSSLVGWLDSTMAAN